MTFLTYALFIVIYDILTDVVGWIYLEYCGFVLTSTRVQDKQEYQNWRENTYYGLQSKIHPLKSAAKSEVKYQQYFYLNAWMYGIMWNSFIIILSDILLIHNFLFYYLITN